MHGRTVSAPSKLEELRAQYHFRLLQEKEQKVAEFQRQHEQEKRRLYSDSHFGYDSQTKAGNRTYDKHNSAGGVEAGRLRDFFRQRRATENGGREMGRIQKKNSFNSPSSLPNSAGKPPLPQKQTYGRDRANLLQPLDQPAASPQRQIRGVIRADRIYANGAASPNTPNMFSGKTQQLRPLMRRGSLNSAGTETGSDSDSGVRTSPPKFGSKGKALVPISPKAHIHHQKPVPQTVPQQPPAKAKAHVHYPRPPPHPKPDQYHNDSNSDSIDREASGSASSRNSSGKVSSFRRWQLEQHDKRSKRQDSVGSDLGADPNNNTNDTPKWDKNPQDDLNGTYGVKKPKSKQVQQQKKKAIILQRQNSFNRNRYDSSSEDREEEDSDGVDASDDIKRKEAALNALIKKQEAELQKLRDKRHEEAERERNEKEQRQKRQEAARERHRKVKEATGAAAATPSPTLTRRSPAITPTTTRHRSPSPAPISTRTQASPKKQPPPKPSSETRRPSYAPQREPTPTNDNTTFYLKMAEGADAMGEAVDVMPCPSCGRKFAPDRLSKHTKVCQENPRKKKRKVYDTLKMRTQGTEHAQLAKRAYKETRPAPKKSDWRAKHDDFVKTIRYAKKVSEIEKQGGNLAELPPPPVSSNPDYVECPSCSRRFNNKAAERHIPFCKNQKSRPPPLRR